MVLHLAEHLDVPLRERNALLLAAGFAPTFPRPIWPSPTSETVGTPSTTCSTATSPTRPRW